MASALSDINLPVCLQQAFKANNIGKNELKLFCNKEELEQLLSMIGANITENEKSQFIESVLSMNNKTAQYITPNITVPGASEPPELITTKVETSPIKESLKKSTISSQDTLNSDQSMIIEDINQAFKEAIQLIQKQKNILIQTIIKKTQESLKEIATNPECDYSQYQFNYDMDLFRAQIAKFGKIEKIEEGKQCCSDYFSSEDSPNPPASTQSYSKSHDSQKWIFEKQQSISSFSLKKDAIVRLGARRLNTKKVFKDIRWSASDMGLSENERYFLSGYVTKSLGYGSLGHQPLNEMCHNFKSKIKEGHLKECVEAYKIATVKLGIKPNMSLFEVMILGCKKKPKLPIISFIWDEFQYYLNQGRFDRCDTKGFRCFYNTCGTLFLEFCRFEELYLLLDQVEEFGIYIDPSIRNQADKYCDWLQK